MKKYKSIDLLFLKTALKRINRRAGNWGEFIHNNRHYDWGLTRGCPFCGCFSYIIFCFESIKSRDGMSSYSHPDDAHECVNCGAVGTRRSEMTEKEGPHIVMVGNKRYKV